MKTEVLKIYKTIKSTEANLHQSFPELESILPEQIQFITTQELEYLYPDLSPSQREDQIAKQYGAVFIMQIGGKLNSGEAHDGRSSKCPLWELESIRIVCQNN